MEFGLLSSILSMIPFVIVRLVTLPGMSAYAVPPLEIEIKGVSLMNVILVMEKSSKLTLALINRQPMNPVEATFLTIIFL